MRVPDPAGDRPLDIAIIGAGVSGIGMALHVARRLPGKRVAILEQRSRIGGTWDLFRYPGVRSDSDMYTLGFASEPWRGACAIASGEEVRAYLEEVAARHAITPCIRFGRKVLAADWSGADGWWTLAAEAPGGGRETLRARFLYVGAGFYDYDTPHDAGIAGLASFAGAVIAPQFWPQDQPVADRRVVVVGSGATAATLVPALAAQGAEVTLLQRTPSWYFAHPARDPLAKWLYRLLPARLAYAIARWYNRALQALMFNKARADPEAVGRYLREHLARQLPGHDPADFAPPYGPWVQRLCLVPDGDLFAALRSGRARIVTGRIAEVERDAVRLEDGRSLPADIIVTATGLKMALLGKIAFSLDGAPIDFAGRFHYRGCMFSNVPNFAALFGYLNAAWTLRVDAVAEWLCRLLAQMDAWQADVATPYLAPDHGLVEAADPFHGFTSNWLQRARAEVPRNAVAGPWRLGMDCAADARELRERPIDDGVLRFRRVAGARFGAADAVDRGRHLA